MNIELPKDAVGREIPLDTTVLYDKDGSEMCVKRIDLDRVARCCAISTPACVYTQQQCSVCEFHNSESCTSAMCADIASRIRKLRGKDK